MDVNYIIKEVLSGNKIVDFCEFVNVITMFGIDRLKKYGDVNFGVEDDLSDDILGYCLGDEDMFVGINISVVKKIYYGDKMAFYNIFHEFRHLKYFYDINNKIYSPEIINIIKEKLVNSYVAMLEGKVKLYKDDMGYMSKYYEVNYDVNYEEAVCDAYGYLDMVDYYDEIGVVLSGDDNSLLWERVNKACEIIKCNKRCFDGVLGFKDGCFTLDDAVLAVLDNCPWLLDEFPLLKNEYYVDDSKIKRVKKK